MKGIRITIIAMITLAFCSCATSRRAVKSTWQTAQANNCIATISMDSFSYTIGCSMHVIRDSLIVIAIKPMLPVELGRLEITQKDITAIDKINHRYTQVPYSKTTPIVPRIRWNDLQQFAAGEKAKKGDQVTLTYSFRGHLVTLAITYGDIAYDTPSNIRRLNTEKYKYIDVETFISE